MTKRAKWAFVTKEDADKYIGEHGGTAAEFEHVFKTASEDLDADTKMTGSGERWAGCEEVNKGDNSR